MTIRLRAAESPSQALPPQNRPKIALWAIREALGGIW